MRTLYVRGVPDELLREAKACAARRGTTLTAVVLQALKTSLHRDAPTRAPLRAIQDDIDWYEARKQRLLARYDDEYLAIVNREVVDHDRHFPTLARRVFARFGGRPIFMPRCALQERTVRLGGPRKAAG